MHVKHHILFFLHLNLKELLGFQILPQMYSYQFGVNTLAFLYL